MPAVPSCTYVKVDGTRCNSPALKGKPLCYSHDYFVKNHDRPPQHHFPIELEIYDPDAIQLQISLLAKELLSGTLDSSTAAIMRRGLKLAVRAGKIVRAEKLAETRASARLAAQKAKADPKEARLEQIAINKFISNKKNVPAWLM